MLADICQMVSSQQAVHICVLRTVVFLRSAFGTKQWETFLFGPRSVALGKFKWAVYFVD
jgi:hypothetical protein